LIVDLSLSEAKKCQKEWSCPPARNTRKTYGNGSDYLGGKPYTLLAADTYRSRRIYLNTIHGYRL
jgi:hypothetical protein